MTLWTYRFERPEHWDACLLTRWELDEHGLRSVPRSHFGAKRISADRPTDLVAATFRSRPVWRDAGRLYRADFESGDVESFRLGSALGAAVRWVVERRWLWGLSHDGRHIARYESETLRPNRSFSLLDVLPNSAPEDRFLDIAADPGGGVRLLVRRAGSTHIARITCRDQFEPGFEVSDKVCRPARLGVLTGSSQIALLDEKGTQLTLLGPHGEFRRSIAMGALLSGARAQGLTGNARGVLLWGSIAKEDGFLLILDANGEVLDGVDSLRELTGGEVVAAQTRDAALGESAAWLATDNGVWEFEQARSVTGLESESVLVTRPLVAPQGDASRGWLHAELHAELPAEAFVEVRVWSTDDPRKAQELMQIAGEASVLASERQRRIADRFDPSAVRTYRWNGPFSNEVPLAVPLFEILDRWLVLRIAFVTPAAAEPPRLRTLEVHRSDRSFANLVPAIYRGKNDPEGFFRRLLGVLEVTSRSIDRRIERSARFLDPEQTEALWLDYLARWFDLPWDDGLPDAAKRRVLGATASLLDERGTRAGLSILLVCLLGHRRFVIEDMGVDHLPARFGNGERISPRLPVLLAGRSPTAPFLSTKARIGKARLHCASTNAHPLTTLRPRVRLTIELGRQGERFEKELVPRIVAGFLPAGVSLSVRWRDALDDGVIDESWVLDERGAGALGRTTRLGRTVLQGQLGESGSRLDF